jgi:hypothetical protein
MKQKISKVCVTLGLVLLGWATQPKAQAVDMSVAGFASYLDLDSGGTTTGAGALVRFGLADWFAVDARASYFNIGDLDAALVPLEAVALFRVPLLDKTLVPYAGLGIGYYMFTDSDLAAVSVSDSVGYFPVVGVEFRFGKEKQWSVFGEARWLFIFSDVDAAVSSGLSSDNLSGVGFNLGVSLKF